MNTIESITKRRSVRSFTDQELTFETIEELINTAICAPTAQRKEPWCFLVIQGKEKLKEISDMAKKDILENIDNIPEFKAYEKFFTDEEYNLFYKAENLVVIYGDKNERWYKEDCSLVAGNLITAAFSKKIGSCWIAFSEYIFNREDIREKYNIPEGYVPVAPIILGYTDREMNPPKRKTPLILK